jgi:16S rRNA (cytosine1407-C5)-methyltransferase
MRYGETFGRTQPAQFDRVLLDAPCSAEGRFDVREPKSYRFWKLRKVHEMANKQKRLLASAIQCLKPGGSLVYSTCTFAPEENEAVLDWALERFKGICDVATIRSPITGCLAGLIAWAGKTYHPLLYSTLRVLPTENLEGFFLARLLKK